MKFAIVTYGMTQFASCMLAFACGVESMISDKLLQALGWGAAAALLALVNVALIKLVKWAQEDELRRELEALQA